LKVKDIYNLIIDLKDQKDNNVSNFKLDKDLSTSSTKVYFNPNIYQAVVIHQRTNTFENVIMDISALFGLKIHLENYTSKLDLLI
jgi:hypothetical protein